MDICFRHAAKRDRRQLAAAVYGALLIAIIFKSVYTATAHLLHTGVSSLP